MRKDSHSFYASTLQMIDHTVKKDPNINKVEILFRSTFHKPIPLSTTSKRNEPFQKKEKKNTKKKLFAANL